MLWQYERYPILRVKTEVLAPTTCGTQKGCGMSMADRQIQTRKVFRKGQYDRGGLAPSGRGMADPVVKVVSA